MNNIKRFRLEKGMKQEELSRKTGLSNGYICHLEKGSRNNPSKDTMNAIAKALGKTVTEVFEV